MHAWSRAARPGWGCGTPAWSWVLAGPHAAACARSPKQRGQPWPLLAGPALAGAAWSPPCHPVSPPSLAPSSLPLVTPSTPGPLAWSLRQPGGGASVLTCSTRAGPGKEQPQLVFGEGFGIRSRGTALLLWYLNQRAPSVAAQLMAELRKAPAAACCPSSFSHKSPKTANDASGPCSCLNSKALGAL